ncbi:Cellulase family glycosylhydrolase [Entamoeba marina]
MKLLHLVFVLTLALAFVTVKNQDLINDDGSVYTVKGIAFSNNVYDNSNTDPITDHSLTDYAELSDMGFNSVRFYLNYVVFEDDSNPYTYKEAGFDWLDSEIAAAKTNGIGLILNMHVPQGGYQSQGNSELWSSDEDKDRLKALWKEIANRYVDEETIIGYGLINEPFVTNENSDVLDQWKNIMNGIADSIREVDTNHVLFVEPIMAYKENGADVWNAFNDYGNLDLINDDNTCYEFHFYSPTYFTHQNASWTSYAGTTATYPDDEYSIVGNNVWKAMSDASNSYDVSNQDTWQQITGNAKTVDGTLGINNFNFLLAVQNVGDGSVFMDDVVITEYDENDNVVSTWTEDFSSQPALGLYNPDNTASYSYETSDGHSSNGCLKITGANGEASLSVTNKYPTTINHKYKIDGWIKMSGCSTDVVGKPRIDFSQADSISKVDKEYLENLLTNYLNFKKDKNVPLYIGEFGTIVYSFKESRGGDTWVSDMMDLIVQYGLSFNYHDYHETSFGLYTNDPYQTKDNINEVLKNILVSKLQEMNDQSSDQSSENTVSSSSSGSSEANDQSSSSPNFESSSEVNDQSSSSKFESSASSSTTIESSSSSKDVVSSSYEEDDNNNNEDKSGLIRIIVGVVIALCLI